MALLAPQNAQISFSTSSTVPYFLSRMPNRDAEWHQMRREGLGQTREACQNIPRPKPGASQASSGSGMLRTHRFVAADTIRRSRQPIPCCSIRELAFDFISEIRCQGYTALLPKLCTHTCARKRLRVSRSISLTSIKYVHETCGITSRQGNDIPSIF